MAGLKLASGAGEHLIGQPAGRRVSDGATGASRVRLRRTALTGVEAISNGVPAFRKPKSRNAAITLMIMGGLAIIMFTGITILAEQMKARAYPDGFPSVISQLGAGVWGSRTRWCFWCSSWLPREYLILAAHTAFNGFPVLASILAHNSYLPRQLHQPRRSARLQQRDPVASRLRDRVDHRIQRQHRQADPAIHHRRVHLVHAQPGRHGAALAAIDRRPSTPVRRLRRRYRLAQALNATGADGHRRGGDYRGPLQIPGRCLPRDDRDGGVVRADESDPCALSPGHRQNSRSADDAELALPSNNHAVVLVSTPEPGRPCAPSATPKPPDRPS